MILNLLSTANFWITIFNVMFWYKNIPLILSFFKVFYKVEKTNKTGFLFSSLDIYEHVSPVQVIFIIMGWL